VPELPDIEAYLAALRPRILHQPFEKLRIQNPFLLRTFDPPIESAQGATVTDLHRLGKRIVFQLDDKQQDPLFLILHLMIAGRLLFKPLGSKGPGKITLATFDFPAPIGSLILTEAGSQRRASLHLVRGRAALSTHDPGGLDLLSPTATPEAFTAQLRRENRTIKRALTDPRLFSGIGNAYSDEILHAARLSPVTLTSRLSDDQAAALFTAARQTLAAARDDLTARFLKNFPGPGDVTAFRPEHAVHGKFKQPCPVCGTKVQRIIYADNETNYCPTCQTGGRLLADRSLSRLLKDDWPKHVPEGQ
jgi:formamidopyrimidine-DNA glycosylase